MVVQQGEFPNFDHTIEKESFSLCEQGVHSNGLIINSHCNEVVCDEGEEHGHYIVPLSSELDDSNLHYDNLEGIIIPLYG
ncbi:MAG: hypothetical protein GY928_27235 [Colwellia sp.]|nr:hypothetical protein [Colwellia sp.]